LVWLVVILVKSLYLFAIGRAMEASNSLECYWKNTVTLILLPYRIYSFLSPVRRNVTNSPNFVNLAAAGGKGKPEIPKEFNPTRVRVIGTAAKFSEDIWNFTGDTSQTTWPNMNGATCREMDHNFTKEEAEAAGIIDPHPNDPRPIRPLFIGIRGTCNRLEVLECVYNFFGGRAENFAPIEAFVAKAQEEINRKNATQTAYRYVPVLVGHSMGGAFASAIAVKEGISSITFNSMGWGSELYENVGDSAIRKAATAGNPGNIEISVAGCHVSDPNAFIFQKMPVKTFHLPNCTESAHIHMCVGHTWRTYCQHAGLIPANH
jgi:hypothetical protein